MLTPKIDPKSEFIDPHVKMSTYVYVVLKNGFGLHKYVHDSCMG